MSAESPKESEPRDAEAHASSPPSPSMRSPLQLRVTALAGAVAAGLGSIVLPGVRGNAPERVVVTWEFITHASWYWFCGLVLALLLRGTIDVGRAPRVGGITRAASLGGTGVVVALVVPALSQRLPPAVSVVMVLGAVVTATAGALRGLSAPQTRAVSVIVAALTLAALLRVGAWEIAAISGERADTALYGMSRGVATAAVVIEGAGQLFAAAWLATRARIAGQLLASFALAAAFVLAWTATRAYSPGAPGWQVIVRSALVDAPGTPPPFILTSFATFLAPAGIFLAVVAAVQPNQVVMVVSALALALVARGSYDVPLRALAAVAAGQCLLVATADPKAGWLALTRFRPVLAKTPERF